MDEAIGWNIRTRGRGAPGNVPHRFQNHISVPVEDGDESSSPPLSLKGPSTSIHSEKAKSAISSNKSPDVPFEISVNPYRGCEHGCIYCYARPTHSYLGLSPGLDFETELFAKHNIADILSAEISHPRHRVRPIAIGANTDAYQPAERVLKLTRAVLQVLYDHNHPVLITTKSGLILRDLGLLSDMAKKDLVHVSISVTTLEDSLWRAMEPRAASPRRRLEVIRRLSGEKIPVRLLASPMIPGLNDEELERILEAGSAAGARDAAWSLLRLPHELKLLFSRWLEVHYPLRRSRVLHLLRSMRGGHEYESCFDHRMSGRGNFASLLEGRFRAAAKRYNLQQGLPELECGRFARKSTGEGQLELF